MDKYFKHNAEGYTDPTAYIALNNVQKGEYMGIENRIGEIWEMANTNGKGITTGLIIADDGNVITFLGMVEEQNKKHDLEIKCRGMMYASSRMIGYKFVQSLENYVRKVTDEEFDEIMGKVAEALNIESTVIEKVVEKEAFIPHDAPIAEDVSYKMELERTKAQLEVYKGLYENLMQQMIGR